LRPGHVSHTRFDATGGVSAEWQRKAPRRLAERGAERIVGVGNDVGKATNTGRAVKVIPFAKIGRDNGALADSAV
jgi:hypothetical protein